MFRSHSSALTHGLYSWTKNFCPSLRSSQWTMIFTARIRRMREGNIFSLITLAGRGGGVPYPRSRWEVPHPRSGRGGGYPILLTRGVSHLRSGQGGYPIPGLDGGGIPFCWQGGTTSKIRMGVPWVPPSAEWGTPIQDWMGYPPPPQSAKRALATRRAVCLLRSRRRTF